MPSSRTRFASQIIKMKWVGHMRNAKNVIVGFGKAGKTLAFKLAAKVESVILLEKSDQMYGGTCINVGCIPSKLLYTLSTHASQPADYQRAVLNKTATIGKLRQANYQKVADLPTATVITGAAQFVDNHTLSIQMKDGTTETVVGERIIINTGAIPVIPPITGLKSSGFVYNTETLMAHDVLPKHLVIIGGGHIAVEFATTYAQFGAKVTLLVRDGHLLPHLEAEAVAAIAASLADLGVVVRYHTLVTAVVDEEKQAVLSLTENQHTTDTLTADAILVATGRRPNIANLGLENTDVVVEDGAIVTDSRLKTAAPEVWAVGDVRGGAQFTYLSLDDSRIVWQQFFGDGQATLAQQELVPHVLFTNPPLATIGLSEAQAKATHVAYRVAKLSVASLPKTHIEGNTRGYLKVLVGQNDQILGATFFAVAAQEMINLISLAMHQGISYQVLRDQIYTHPSMMEGLNDVFGLIDT